MERELYRYIRVSVYIDILYIKIYYIYTESYNYITQSVYILFEYFINL